uniref:Uncharacterized protein n=1 Tax=Rhizophora mucronata TaxID=61149 RepID=A0A2P2QNI9_RHIMU
MYVDQSSTILLVPPSLVPVLRIAPTDFRFHWLQTTIDLSSVLKTRGVYHNKGH